MKPLPCTLYFHNLPMGKISYCFSSLISCLWVKPGAYPIIERLKGPQSYLQTLDHSGKKHSSLLWPFVSYEKRDTDTQDYFAWVSNTTVNILTVETLAETLTHLSINPIGKTENQLIFNWQPSSYNNWTAAPPTFPPLLLSHFYSFLSPTQQ